MVNRAIASSSIISERIFLENFRWLFGLKAKRCQRFSNHGQKKKDMEKIYINPVWTKSTVPFFTPCTQTNPNPNPDPLLSSVQQTRGSVRPQREATKIAWLSASLRLRSAHNTTRLPPKTACMSWTVMDPHAWGLGVGWDHSQHWLLIRLFVSLFWAYLEGRW